MNSKSIEVAAALVFRNGKLLIAQRHAKAHLGGLWEFPGGKRHAEETFEECLVREIREELGVEISVGELMPRRSPAVLSGEIGALEILQMRAGVGRTAGDRLCGVAGGWRKRNWMILNFRRRMRGLLDKN